VALTENLDVFLRDFGVACSKGAGTFTGILDTPDETMNMGGVNVLSTMYQLTVKTSVSQANSLTSGDSITVAGNPYVIRDVMFEEDGAFTKLTLSK
jgi:hypothetical protein